MSKKQSESFSAFQKRFKPSPTIIGTDGEYNAWEQDKMYRVWKSAVRWSNARHRAKFSLLISERDDNARAAERAMDIADGLAGKCSNQSPTLLEAE
jgi:Mg-chelatase subunit ChlD